MSLTILKLKTCATRQWHTTHARWDFSPTNLRRSRCVKWQCTENQTPWSMPKRCAIRQSGKVHTRWGLSLVTLRRRRWMILQCASTQQHFFLFLTIFKTQEMCEMGVEEDPLSLEYIPDHLKTLEMCDEATWGDPSSLVCVLIDL